MAATPRQDRAQPEDPTVDITLDHPRTLRMQVADALRSAVLTGKLAPGSQLHEVALAKMLGVSRGPLREAMRQLVEEGLLRNEPYRGTFVTSLSLRDIEEIYSFRTALETLAFERAWPRRDARFRAELRSRYETLLEVTERGDAERAIEAALDLHGLVYTYADHDLLQATWHTLRSRLQFYFSVHQQAHGRSGPAPEGDVEYVRLAQGEDLDAMLREVRVHMQRGVERVRRFVGTRPVTDGAGRGREREEKL